MDNLPLDYPVHADYIYVAILEDGSQKSIRSDIVGDVESLMHDLKEYYKLPVIAIRAARFDEMKHKEEPDV